LLKLLACLQTSRLLQAQLRLVWQQLQQLRARAEMRRILECLQNSRQPLLLVLQQRMLRKLKAKMQRYKLKQLPQVQLPLLLL